MIYVGRFVVFSIILMCRMDGINVQLAITQPCAFILVQCGQTLRKGLFFFCFFCWVEQCSAKFKPAKSLVM